MNAQLKPQFTTQMSLPSIDANDVQNTPKAITDSKNKLSGHINDVKQTASRALRRGIQSKLGNNLR